MGVGDLGTSVEVEGKETGCFVGGGEVRIGCCYDEK